MTEYQQTEISRLQRIGWSQSGSQTFRGKGRNSSFTIHQLANQSGHRAYVYPDWTQHII